MKRKKNRYDAENKVCEEQLACVIHELDEGNWCAFTWILIQLHIGCVFAW